MSINTGPGVVTDGLVLHLDASVGFKGEPSNNLIEHDFNNWDSYGGKYVTVWGKGPNNEVAYKIEDTSSSSYQGVQLSSVTLSAGETYTYSVWFMQNESMANCRSHFRLSNSGYESLGLNHSQGSMYYARSDSPASTVSYGISETKFVGSDRWVRAYTTFIPSTANLNFAPQYLIGHDGSPSGSSAVGYAITCSPQLEHYPRPTKITTTTGRLSTDVWEDLSGNNNHATLSNLTTNNTLCAQSDNIEYLYENGGVIDFKYENGYFYGETVNTMVGGSTVDRTYECWFKTNNNTTEQLPFGILGYNSGVVVSSFIYAWNYVRKADNSGFTSFNVSGPATITDKWYQVVSVCTSTSTKLYVDGVFINSKAVTDYLYFHGAAYKVGGSGYKLGTIPNEYQYVRFNGSVAICRLYNRELTAQEVKQNYNAQKSRFGLT